MTGRLQLTHLVDELRADLADGRLPFGHAWLLSRLQPADQAEMRDRLYEEYGPDRGEVCSLQELKRRIRNSRVHPLSAAPWKWDDADLVPSAGSCKACPKRSGNNRTLFDELLNGDAKKGQEFCTDGACYRAKRDAFVELQVRKVGERSGGEALKLSERYGTRREDILTPDRYEVLTAKEARAAKPGEVRQAVVVEWYEDTQVGKVVHVRLKKSAAESFDRRQEREEAARRRKQKAGQAAAQKATAAAAAAVERAAADGTLLTGPDPIARQLALALADALGADACRAVANRRGLPKNKANQRQRIEDLAAGIATSAELLALVAELVAARKSLTWGHPYFSGSQGAEERAFRAAFGVDRAKLIKAAEADQKEKAGAKKGKKAKAAAGAKA